ncbi:MAG: hypothetical protein M1399_03475 [Actinobacteria bacterium]|nr:hypothetical protein [Actinomycetota bacterium]MCL5446532.1 hypothetical protein [Actinomycetota bacterium]
MTVLILLAIIWIVVLGSQLWKRRSERRSTQSVWAFRRQLVTLRKRYTELTPIDDFRHTRHSYASDYDHGYDRSAEREYSTFSAYEAAKVMTSGSGWSSHERLSMVRVIGPEAAADRQDMPAPESGRAYSRPYVADLQASTYDVPGFSATTHVPAYDTTSRHDMYYDRPVLMPSTDGWPAADGLARNESAGSRYAAAGPGSIGFAASRPAISGPAGSRSPGNGLAGSRSAGHRVEYRHRVSLAVRRRRILAGLVATTLLCFLFGLIPAAGFFMILSVSGMAVTGAYIVLLALLAQAGRTHARGIYSGRIVSQAASRPSHAHHLANGRASADGSREAAGRRVSTGVATGRQALAGVYSSLGQAGNWPGQAQASPSGERSSTWRALPAAASCTYGNTAAGSGGGAGSEAAGGYRDHSYDREPAPVRTVG